MVGLERMKSESFRAKQMAGLGRKVAKNSTDGQLGSFVMGGTGRKDDNWKMKQRKSRIVRQGVSRGVEGGE